MNIINMATYLYKTSVKVGQDVNGNSRLKEFIFMPGIKTEISEDDYKLLLTHPNFKYRIDHDLIKIDGLLKLKPTVAPILNSEPTSKKAIKKSNKK